MTKNGPIIIVEDDPEDRELLSQIFKKIALNNEIIFFENGDLAFEYLNNINNRPFIIISDVNLPKMNGFELKKLIRTNELLSLKCIPFLFLTTGTNGTDVIDAYAMSAQGFFQKPNSISELETLLRTIVQYWQKCIAPSEFIK
jgi:DNA-binding response OmpR family regulator